MSKPSGSKAGPSGPTMDILIKYMGDVNASIASVQQSVDELKDLVNKKFEALEEMKAEEQRNITARFGTMGNQVSYFRQTMCSSLKETVSKIIEIESES